MSAVVLPAAISHFTSTQVIFSNSTRSVCGHVAARADPAASIREAVPPAINISKQCETEPMRMSFSFPQKHKLAAVLTENRQFYKFIIITKILPFPHDSEIWPNGVQNTASRHKRAGGATLYIYYIRSSACLGSKCRPRQAEPRVDCRRTVSN